MFFDNFLTNCSDFCNARFGESFGETDDNFLSVDLTDDTDFLEDDLTDDLTDDDNFLNSFVDNFLTARRTEGENFFKYAFCLGVNFLESNFLR